MEQPTGLGHCMAAVYMELLTVLSGYGSSIYGTADSFVSVYSSSIYGTADSFASVYGSIIYGSAETFESVYDSSMYGNAYMSVVFNLFEIWCSYRHSSDRIPLGF